MRNIYKYLHIYKCVHESHRNFKSKVSVFHVLHEKKCFPDGCIYFKWYCRKLNKGHQCPRKFKHVGKNCFGCRDFYEEKIHNYPEINITGEEYEKFLHELEEYQDWLDEHLNRPVEFFSTIDGIKPLFKKKIYPKASYLSFRGFMLIFKQIYLGMTHFDDYVYARISPKTYSGFKFGKGDKILAKAILTMEQGRLILTRCHHVDIEERGETPFWDESKARIMRESATLFSRQPEECVRCPFGSLVDVEDFKYRHRYYRQLYCLKGMRDYKDCFVPAEICDFQIRADI